MKSQINLLRQLQDLILTREEHLQTGDGSRLDMLGRSISSMEEQLCPQLKALYEKLSKRNKIVIASMSNGCCCACGMHVPTAQVQQVRMAKHLVTCTGCGKILFADDECAHLNPGEKNDSEELKKGISRFSAAELMLPHMKAADMPGAIEELAKLMDANGFITNADALIAAAMDREAILSTAIGNKIAFPHVRGVEGGGLAFAMGTSESGIDWNGETVNIVFLSAIPVAVSPYYLKLMSWLTQAVTKKDNLDILVGSDNPEMLWKTLVKATRYSIK